MVQAYSVSAVFGFDAHVQRQLAVNPVHPFVVEAEAFDVAQVQKAQAKSPVALTGSDTEQPVGNDLIFFIPLRLVAVATFADNKQLAGKTNADIPALYRILRHLLSTRWRHHFFAIAS